MYEKLHAYLLQMISILWKDSEKHKRKNSKIHSGELCNAGVQTTHTQNVVKL